MVFLVCMLVEVGLLLKNGRMANKNRGSLDIVHDVLSIASVKMRKTRIMYRANLSFAQVKKYLRVLLRSGLLERDGDSSYLITERGREFLEFYETYLEESTRLVEDVKRNMKNRLQLENMCFNIETGASQTGIGKDDFA
jgi:predicted transcriptional regulator